jgi:hypothetical protein
MFAGKVEREYVFFPLSVFFGQDHRAMAAFAESELERVSQAATLIRAGDDAIDHDIELLGLAAREQAGGFFERGDGAVDADARESAATEIGGGFQED